jgi:hypothetical protein
VYRVAVCGVLSAVFFSSAGSAQQSASNASAAGQADTAETLRILLLRVAHLEAEVKQLKAEKEGLSATATNPAAVGEAPTLSSGSAVAGSSAAAGGSTVAGNGSTLAGAGNAMVAESATAPGAGADRVALTAQQAADHVASAAQAAEPMEGMPTAGLGSPIMRIRGFADAGYSASDAHGTTNSFALGQFNLFITSQLSQQFSVLSETVIEADPGSNLFGVDLERLLLLYRLNDYFNLSVGRFHTSIGYYSTAYHHSAWLQTTTGRPFLFDFEDHGGILPIHSVGISATGLIPSGSLGLHYVAEMGNGRGTRTAIGDNPVQNVTDENNGKSVNLAVYARPAAFNGFQAGFSIYHENLTPPGIPQVGEIILAAHAIYEKPKFEFLNEVVMLRHSLPGGAADVHSTGFYSQISRKWENYRPYFRYEFVNVPNRDPIFPDVQLNAGPSFGLRYDWSDFVAFKIQYDRRNHRGEPTTNALGLQLSYAF